MHFKRFGAVLFGISCFWLAQSAQASLDLRIVPVSADIEINATTTADIYLNATLGDQFIGFGLDLLFDPSVLEFELGTVDAAFDGLTEVVEQADRIKFLGLTAGTVRSGDVRLGGVSFLGKAIGSSDLQFEFPDYNPNGLLDGIFQPIPPGGAVLPDNIATTSITVNPPQQAPLPSTLVLALIGLATLRRLTLRRFT